MVSRVVVSKDQIIGDHVEYTLEVSHPAEGSWKFQRRYSALRLFHANLQRNVQISLPGFPPKKMFGNLKPAFVTRRRLELQNYFTELVRIAHVVNSKEFGIFIKPTDKVVLQTKVNSVPIFSSPQAAPESPKPLSASVYTQAEIEKKYLRLVEDVSSFFINLASKSNPLEEDDVERKRREYISLLQKSMPATWGPAIIPMKDRLRSEDSGRTASTSLTNLPGSDSSPGLGCELDRNLCFWIINEATEVHRAWNESQIPEVLILSKPV